MKLRPVEAEILIKALAGIGFQPVRQGLPDKSPQSHALIWYQADTIIRVPGVGMISSSMSKRDRNTRLSRAQTKVLISMICLE